MTRLPCPTEHAEACQLMQLVRLHRGRYPELETNLFHVPNGGKRGKATAGQLKGEGVRKGVLDYYLLVPRGGFHGMALELKRMHGGGLEPEQRDEINRLRANGYHATWARGAQAAFEALVAYLRMGVDKSEKGSNLGDTKPLTGD